MLACWRQRARKIFSRGGQHPARSDAAKFAPVLPRRRGSTGPAGSASAGRLRSVPASCATGQAGAASEGGGRSVHTGVLKSDARVAHAATPCSHRLDFNPQAADWIVRFLGDIVE
jgi:hypothetical protein